MSILFTKLQQIRCHYNQRVNISRDCDSGSRIVDYNFILLISSSTIIFFRISTCRVGSDFYTNVGEDRHPSVSLIDSRERFSFGLTDVFNDASTATGGESLRWSGDVVDSAEATWTLLRSRRDQYGLDEGESNTDISASTRREHAVDEMGGSLASPEISNLSRLEFIVAVMEGVSARWLTS